jgi:hypothetical protein
MANQGTFSKIGLLHARGEAFVFGGNCTWAKKEPRQKRGSGDLATLWPV